MHVFGNGDGYRSKDCYSDYQSFCKEYGYAPYSQNKFGIKIKRYVNIVKRKRDGEVNRYYEFNDDGVELYQKHLIELENIPEDKPIPEDKIVKSKSKPKLPEDEEFDNEILNAIK